MPSSSIIQTLALILWVSKRGTKRSAYWAYFSINCSITPNSSLFLFLSSSSFSFRMTYWYISLGRTLLSNSSHFLYFFCRVAIFSISTFFFIFPTTLSVYNPCVCNYRFLYCSLVWSNAWLIFSMSVSFRAKLLSASFKLFIIFPKFYLALLTDFFSWMDVWGSFLTPPGSLFKAAVCFNSISYFLFTARSISILILSWAFIKLSYFNCILCSYLVNSSISDFPTFGSKVSCISFSSWYFLSHKRICLSHSTI